MSGPVGVYSAWCPYEEYYIVTNGWRIVEEFSGWMANERLESYLIKHNINYPRTNISPTTPKNREVEKKNNYSYVSNLRVV